MKEKSTIEQRRIQLRGQIDAFNRLWEGILGEKANKINFLKSTKIQEEEEEWFDEEEEDCDDETAGEWPENMKLAMPSVIGPEQCQTLGLECLGQQELKLRIGQANDCLENLRVFLGNKMILFKTNVRNASSQRLQTRAWADVKKVDAKIKKITRSYHRARQAIIILTDDEKILHMYQVIKAEDLKVSGDVVEENRFGQRNEKIAWFWKLGANVDNIDWMDESKPKIYKQSRMFNFQRQYIE